MTYIVHRDGQLAQDHEKSKLLASLGGLWKEDQAREVSQRALNTQWKVRGFSLFTLLN